VRPEEVTGDDDDSFIFRFCPGCGRRGIASKGRRRWRCPVCGFEYFHNVATAAGVLVELSGGILLLERAKEPGRGRLCLPGGFVEPGESLEEAARRECREEIGWTPGSLTFVASFPNDYPFKGVPYSTCDCYFSCRASDAEGGPLDQTALRLDPTESQGLVVAPFCAIPWERLAFPSVRRILELLAARPRSI
jgi:ADP-ribose pyrophosphatase YjhB (NUDIX family)